MATFTANFPELMETRMKQIFFMNFTQVPQTHREIMQHQTSTKSHEDRMRVAGLGRFALKPEGSPIAFDDPVQGSRIRTVHSTSALGFRATHEAIADDQFNIIDRIPSDLGESARDYQERLAWDVINDGFAAATYTGLDGLGLFSTAHTSIRPGVANQSNSLSPAIALSQTGLETIARMARTTQSEEGRFVSVRQQILVIHEDLAETAYVLLNSAYKPGSGDNDVSTVVSTRTGMKVVATPYKTSTTNWSVHDAPGRNSLQWNDREILNFSEMKDADTLDRKYYAMFRSSTQFSEWRGNFGSNA
jgi:hypothetical protein